jgi:hypothetical protein
MRRFLSFLAVLWPAALCAADADWVMIVVFEADGGRRIIEQTMIREGGCRILLDQLRRTGPFQLTIEGRTRMLTTGRAIEIYCIAPDGRILTPRVTI